MSAREVIALQEFARWAIRESAFQAADLDGLSIQEKAHELGLIEVTTYDPERHGPSDCADPGDEWFTFAPSLTAAGYVILSPDEVRGIRDDALEEAANEAKSWEKTARKLSRKEPNEDRSLYHSLAGDMARDVASAIRSLKGGRDVA